MEPEDVVPLQSEFVQTGFKLYLLDVNSALQVGEADPSMTLAMVVMTRQGGLLFAVPELAVPMDFLDEGNRPGFQGLVGPSTRLEVACAVVDEDAIADTPKPIEGRSMAILLVDFSDTILQFVNVAESREDIEAANCFDILEPFLVPELSDLISKAAAWADGGGEDLESRLHFYSAEEVPTTPPVAPRRTARRKGPGVGTTGDEAPKPAAKKRPTVNQLAESLEVLTSTLPAITTQLQELSLRTEVIEQGMSNVSRPSALRAPLGPSATVGYAKASSPAELIKAMPPPRSSSAQPHVSFAQQEVEELQTDLPVQSNDFARAIMEQSKALTALVSQLASNSADPMQDLGSASSSLSSKGSVGRARLQAELAAHRGTFHLQVMQAMSRRMYPAMSTEVEMSTLRDRGVTATQYLERYGGYGRTRDIGMIIWQVGMVLNHMQEENFLAAKDALSLLFVCLEQTALDNGNMQVGLLLSLTEDPPSSLFSARSIATAANPKPFAPTASQKWVTVALQYLKEVDIITTRRQEITAPKNQSSKGETESQPKAASKKKPKGRGKGKNQEGQTAEEEA